ncbi:hypothetical protein [Rhodohalobacter sp.]|uniref:hypothetical protein n=1 Tax=Rhodohalobacter sp. TaxID=1974210 RepID=UPI002ACEC7D6|nr:hypothetical protein [Rhodohalobacter sp.]MDZ7757521.1 hypothetical protein [Rhodohalobacter sp.]
MSKIKKMIRHQRENYSWEFIFLGANQDTFAEAAKIGIDSKTPLALRQQVME